MRVTLDELEVTYLESELGWGYRIPVTPYLGDDNIPQGVSLLWLHASLTPRPIPLRR